MKFLNFDRVLCLSPHPDDVEYSMSGTIMKYSDTEFDILTLTCGGDYDETTKHVRKNEVIAFWSYVNYSKLVNLLFTDFVLMKEMGMDGWINWIETEILSKTDYDCIISTSSEDSHFEHIFISKFPRTLARKRKYSILEYRSPSTFDEWTPNLSVDISNVYDDKVRGLKKFESQLKHSYFNDDIVESFHKNWEDNKRGINYTEEFKIVKLYE